MDWSTVITAETFAPLVSGMQSIVPVVLGLIVSLAIIRKGIDFVKGMIYSA